MIKVFVVIITYNGSKWIDKCFGSLINSTFPVKVLVIDNASTDNTPDLIKRKYPDVDIIQSKHNIGFGAANNIGIKKAYHSGADYIFLLNQDAWLEMSTVEKLLSAHNNQPDFDIISPVHLNAKGTALDYGFSCYISPDNCKGLYSDVFVKNDIDRIYEATFVNAAGWLLTRKCITTIGGFNPSFYHYGEDTNYLQRVQYHGLKLGVYPNCCIYHDRENRPSNKVFENDTEVYKRQIISKISDPNLEFTFFSELIFLFRQFLYCLIKFRFIQIRDLINRINIIYSVDKTFIIANRKKSKLIGPTFLD